MDIIKEKIKPRSWDTYSKINEGKTLHWDPLAVNYLLDMEIGMSQKEINGKLSITN